MHGGFAGLFSAQHSLYLTVADPHPHVSRPKAATYIHTYIHACMHAYIHTT